MSEKYEPGIFSGLVPARATLAGLVAVALLVVGLVLVTAQLTGGEEDTARPATDAASDTRVLLKSTAADGASATARLDAGVLRVSLQDLDPARAGEHHALWLVNSDDDLLPLGAFRLAGSGGAEISVPVPVPLESYRRIEISREPDDGNPDRTGPVVLSGATR